MAKQTSVLTMRKKVGNLVGYGIKNSNNAEKAGVRIYQPIVTNPKSDPQSAQRMKLMPLQVFYDSFNDVLNHAFEGRKVGQMNRQRFMQLNMGATSGVAPAVQKGERLLAPIKCQVSSGSVTVDTTLVKGEDNQQLLSASLKYRANEPSSFEDLSIAEFSQGILSANFGVEEGMEIAVIGVLAKDDSPRFGVPFKFYIVLDKSNTTTKVKDMMGGFFNYVYFGVTTGDKIELSGSADHTQLMGAAIIVSKRSTSSWKNSNSRLVPTAIGEQYFYTQALYDAALATYGKTGTTLESDLFLQQADNAAEALNPKAVVSVESLAIELKDEFAGAQLSAANVGVAVTRAGERLICTLSDGQLCTNEGVGITITVHGKSGDVTRPLMMAQTKLEGNKTIVWGSF